MSGRHIESYGVCVSIHCMALYLIIFLYFVFNSTVGDMLHQFLDATDSLVKVVHLDKAKSAAVAETYTIISRIQFLYVNLQSYTSVALVSHPQCAQHR